MPASYIVYKTFRGSKPAYRAVRKDEPDATALYLETYPTRHAAMTAMRLLAGRTGRVAFTTDPTTYPW